MPRHALAHRVAAFGGACACVYEARAEWHVLDDTCFREPTAFNDFLTMPRHNLVPELSVQMDDHVRFDGTKYNKGNNNKH